MESKLGNNLKLKMMVLTDILWIVLGAQWKLYLINYICAKNEK